ncbi:MAG: YceI family protein [Thiotrichales bacterium]
MHRFAQISRRTLTALLACAGLALAQAAPAAPANYEIDPEHLSVGFLVDHVGYAKVLGMFRNASGFYTFDETTGELTNLRIVVDSASVFSNHKKRDEHLRGADFLNSAEFPEMVFTAASGRRDGERGYVINGELKLLGRAQPVTLQATWNKSAEYPFGPKNYAMGVSARGSFKRSAYDMNYAVANGWVGDEVELIIELEAVRK